MASTVYFADLRAFKEREGVLFKIGELLEKLYKEKPFFKPGDLVGVKAHFGEPGLATFLRPIFARAVVEKIKEKGAVPFLFDTTTLYTSGSRTNAATHIATAINNGFTYAPIIIADGLTGSSYTEVEIDGKHFRKVKLARDILYMDAIVCLSHFTGHCGTGFGAAIKSISMGMASRAGKLQMHSASKPYIKANCIGCGECIAFCPAGAIEIKDKKAVINAQLCIGCMQCDTHCPVEAIRFHWDTPATILIENMVEYASGVVKEKKDKMVYFNFLFDITPDCDCFKFNDAPIVPDIGIVASRDPVAVDQASVDLVNKQPGLKNTALKKAFKEGEDKIKDLWPKIDYQHIFEYGEKTGLGTRQYRLI